jgi:hypothetical protein
MKLAPFVFAELMRAGRGVCVSVGDLASIT